MTCGHTWGSCLLLHHGHQCALGTYHPGAHRCACGTTDENGDQQVTTPPEVTHERPDSRGLPYGVIEAPRASGLIRIAGRYLAAPDCPQTAPCHVCGTVQPVVLTLAADPPYAICPAAEGLACVIRGQAKRAAERAAAVASAAIGGAARARAETASRPARKRRPTQARKTLLGQKAAAT